MSSWESLLPWSMGFLAHVIKTSQSPGGTPAETEFADFAAWVDSLPDAVVGVDAAGLVALFNPAAERMFGRAAAEITGTALGRILNPGLLEAERVGLEPLPKVPQHWRALEPGPRFQGFRADGEVISLSGTIHRIEVAGQPMVTAVLREDSETAKLERSSVELAAIVESSDDAIIGKDLNGVVTSWNRGAENLFGYSAPEMIGQSILRVIPAELESEEDDILDRLRRGEKIDHYETVRQRKDGSRIDVSVTISPINDRAGHIAGASKVARDISERRRADERLAWLASLPEHNPNPVIEVDLDAKQIHFANPGALRHFPDLLSIGVRHPVFPDLEPIREQLLSGGTGVVKQESAVGDRTFVMSVIVPPATRRLRFYCTEITALKKSEAALIRERNFIAAVVDTIGSVVVVLDSAGRVASTNRAFEALTGYGSDEIKGLEGIRLLTFPEETQTSLTRAQRLQENKGTTTSITHLRAKDGTKYRVEWISTCILDQNGEIEYVVATGTDLTESFRLEQELRNSRDELEIRVAERTAELATTNRLLQREIVDRRLAISALKEAVGQIEAARAEADRANLAKSEFLSSMSHELRTPLNAILGFGQILEEPDSEAYMRECVGHIMKGGRHLLDLINEVLDIARVETGHLQVSTEPIGLAEIVPDVCSLVSRLAAERGIRLENNLSHFANHFVLADRQRLKQILLNLLANAIKYNREGGSVEIFLGAETPGRISIGIRDTGPGISPQNLSKLFTPFERLGAANSAVEGTGLGLALSRRLVEAMDGIIRVESELGHGSVFTIELPRADSPKLPEATETNAAGPIGGVAPGARLYTVLCIEDNPSNLRLIEVIFGSRPGFKLLTAIQGSIGLDLARQHAPDVILLDLNLPDMNGKEVLKRLAQTESTRAIPVIVVSADATAERMTDLLDAGAKAFLTKPLNVNQLFETLDRWLTARPPQEAA